MSGPGTISPAFAEAPAALIRRLLVICPITMGLCPFLQLKPRLRG
ncbi:hypothetical protein [Cyanobium sp. BA20m-p-22]|nr:hypothetical protein [Cyanobium sp. BA20m-p-22]